MYRSFIARRFLSFILVILLPSCFAPRDSLAPIITIYKPANGAVQANNQTTVEGYVMDDDGVVSLRVNDTEMLDTEFLQPDRNKRLIQFAFRPTQQGEGDFTATIVARDASGRETLLPYRLLIDQTPPTLELEPPEDIGNGRLRVRGIARDDSAVNEISVGGEPVQFIASAEQTFSVDIEAFEGLSVEVSDQAGNTVSQVVQ